MNDPVNHPKHYKLNKEFEVIDIIDSHVDHINDGREAVYSANVLKYVLRYRSKGGIESLKKARWYLDRMISYMEERQQTYGNYERKTKVVTNETMVEQMDKAKRRTQT
jgi:hypothetical protein